ncbi:MAG: NAD-dependent protein deacylase [Lachnospiraceae bacterium]|nr:NAD-dependent protein deacylase [Lachnospiraceae bacterium]MDE6625050.1 NAD-dependent protein deacylase [Lachnospiraceae bacterium]
MLHEESREKIQKLKKIVEESDNIVFFGGAGVSTESGIPDFRSVDGLYNQQYKYPPEVMVSHSFYVSHPEEFFDFYKKKMIALEAKPNAAHLKLADLEKQGKVKAVITQNIDGLHYAAGSKEVLELHGSVHRNYCESCRKSYPVQYIVDAVGVPKCECGATVKPDVVLYEEGLDPVTMQKTVQYIRNAEVLIIGGTSLAVYPAAGFIDYFNGKHLIVINMDETARDVHADLLINERIGEVFQQI